MEEIHMARIAGVDLPRDKRVEIGLTYIYGIGRTSATRILKEEGISEVHYIGNLEKKLDFIPGFVTTPWMISGMGIIYGKK